MIINQNNFFNESLRDLFCDKVNRVFGGSEEFLDFLENEEYSPKYDCYLDGSSENYIINRETGEYINWYKLSHLGRCINISANITTFRDLSNFPKWIADFLIDFKHSGSDVL